jgi:hypothetical protein
MRYQIRLQDRTLPGFVRDLTLALRKAVLDAFPGDAPGAAYRALYRALKSVFLRRVTANRYCGGAMSCEHSLTPSKGAPKVAHEAFPGERVRIYLVEPEVGPEGLIHELLGSAVKALFRMAPHPHAGRLLRKELESGLKGKVFRSDLCGVSPLCHANEPYDPWEGAPRTRELRRRA